MPVNFTGDPIWREVITGPSDGDEASGLSVSDMGVLLADRTAFLFELLGGGIGERIVPFTAARNDGSTWIYVDSVHRWRQDSIGADNTIHVELPHYAHSQITSWTAYLEGATGHAALPATMPNIALGTLDVVTGLFTAFVGVTDSSASVAAYEAYHQITQTFVTPVEFEGNRVIASITGEGGANSISGLELAAIAINLEPA